MKKIILAVIIVAAAGGGAYYLLKKQNSSSVIFNKELATGKWKIDSLVAANDTSANFALLLFAIDSNARKLVYDFQADGKVFVTNPADSSAKKDTSAFAWGKEKEILWKEKSTDSTTESMTVVKLNKEDFVLQSKDSILVYFRKIK